MIGVKQKHRSEGGVDMPAFFAATILKMFSRIFPLC